MAEEEPKHRPLNLGDIRCIVKRMSKAEFNRIVREAIKEVLEEQVSQEVEKYVRKEFIWTSMVRDILAGLINESLFRRELTETVNDVVRNNVEVRSTIENIMLNTAAEIDATEPPKPNKPAGKSVGKSRKIIL